MKTDIAILDHDDHKLVEATVLRDGVESQVALYISEEGFSLYQDNGVNDVQIARTDHLWVDRDLEPKGENVFKIRPATDTFHGPEPDPEGGGVA